MNSGLKYHICKFKITKLLPMSESKLEHAYLNPLQLNISMHNLQPVLYMSPMLLTTKFIEQSLVIFSYIGIT